MTSVLVFVEERQTSWSILGFFEAMELKKMLKETVIPEDRTGKVPINPILKIL